MVIGVILGGIGIYRPLTEFAGAGATVPLTGFGNCLAKGVKEAIQEKGFIGIFTGAVRQPVKAENPRYTGLQAGDPGIRESSRTG